MSLVPYALTRPFLFGLDPEQAHDLTLGALARIQRTPLICTVQQRRVADPVRLAGLTFPNRIGLAAGLDKNGRCIDGLAALGFGAIEVGTVTPKPQPGNPKPRMFRLPDAQALINRLGFNNDGLDAFISNVRRAHFRRSGGILGLNIGKNATTPIERAADDYLACLEGVYPHADYVTVNISSPNTANLRSLQSDAALDALLSALQERRAVLARPPTRPRPRLAHLARDLQLGDDPSEAPPEGEAGHTAPRSADRPPQARDLAFATDQVAPDRGALQPRARGHQPHRSRPSRSHLDVGHSEYNPAVPGHHAAARQSQRGLSHRLLDERRW